MCVCVCVHSAVVHSDFPHLSRQRLKKGVGTGRRNRAAIHFCMSEVYFVTPSSQVGSPTTGGRNQRAEGEGKKRNKKLLKEFGLSAILLEKDPERWGEELICGRRTKWPHLTWD